MKNISFNLNSVITSPPTISPIISEPPKIINVNLSVQFNDETEALAFTKYMIENIENFRDSMNEE